MNNKLLEEIALYRLDFLESLLRDQNCINDYIMNKCLYCEYHDEVKYNQKPIHTCNDIWSGLNASDGEHITYCETIDICLECNGFKRKSD